MTSQRSFDLELARFHAGLLFVYFSSVDLNSHMFWRAFDRDHPATDPEMRARFGGTIEWFHEQMDEMLGQVLKLYVARRIPGRTPSRRCSHAP
jgi:hypothetical protein